MDLIVQTFREENPDRQAEYEFCLRRNLEHPGVSALHDLAEGGHVPAEDIREHPKYRRADQEERLSYARAFEYAAENCGTGWVAVGNLDVFLAPQFTVANLDALPEPVVLCLSRMEFDPEAGTAEFDADNAGLQHGHTQDLWVFRSPIEVPECDFPLGTIGCDLAIAERLRRSGRFPVNDCRRFPVIHFDRCREKNAGNMVGFHLGNHPDQSLPHEQGQWLLPAKPAGRPISLDSAAEEFGFNELEKYAILCQMMNRRIKIAVKGQEPETNS